MRHKRSILCFLLLAAVSANVDASVSAELIDGSRLRLRFDPAPPAGEMKLESDHTIPLALRTDGRSEYVVPLLLLPRAARTFELRTDAGPATIDLYLHPSFVLPMRLGGPLYDVAPPERPIDDGQRRVIVLGALLAGCAIVGCTLLPKRAALAGVAFVSVASIAVAVAWNRQRPVWVERRAAVEVIGSGGLSFDAWSFLLARRDGSIDWMNPSSQTPRLVPASRSHLDALAPVYRVRADGTVESIRLTLKRGVRVAIVTHHFTGQHTLDPLDLAPLARDFYAGQRVLERSPGRWRIEAEPAQ